MENLRPPNIVRSVKVWFKLLYYEMTTMILLSVAFWIASIPIVTFGAAVLAMFDIVQAIYAGEEPRGERKRVKRFFSLVRVHLRDGFVLSLLISFLVVNTLWYFSISLVGGNLNFIIGGILGVYALLLLIMFICRTVNLHTVSDVDWRTSVRSAASTWIAQPTVAVLQVTIATIIILGIIVVPPALIFIVPAAIVLFEFVYYDDLSGSNPQIALARYKRQDDI